MSGHRPIAIELMAYADGELEPERAAEIEKYLSTSEEGRALVGTFGELGNLVRDHAEGAAQRAGADAIAHEVMKRIEGEPPASMRRPASVHRLRHLAPVAAATAALALAAAVALVVSSMGPSPDPNLRASSSASTRPSSTGVLVASAPTPAPDTEDKEPGVSVDAVEFGAHAGTIFYVPTDTGTTTVVWLTDDD